MRAVSPDFSDAIGQNVTRLCRLWTIERKDGTVFRFTDHDRDIPFDGNIYSAERAFEATAVQATLNSAAADLDVTVLLSPGSIQYEDMKRGMYDDAPVSLQVVNWNDVTAGAMDLFEGRVSTVSLPNQQQATVALIGGVTLTNRYFTERYSPKCRALFGDDRCKVDLTPYTNNFTVTTVASSQSFTAAALVALPTNQLILGTLEWLTGQNAGTKLRIAGNNAGAISLLFRPPFLITPGDTGRVIRGCANTVDACLSYNNIANYRGEPYVPGDDGLGV